MAPAAGAWKMSPSCPSPRHVGHWPATGGAELWAGQVKKMQIGMRCASTAVPPCPALPRPSAWLCPAALSAMPPTSCAAPAACVLSASRVAVAALHCATDSPCCAGCLHAASFPHCCGKLHPASSHCILLCWLAIQAALLSCSGRVWPAVLHVQTRNHCQIHRSMERAHLTTIHQVTCGVCGLSTIHHHYMEKLRCCFSWAQLAGQERQVKGGRGGAGRRNVLQLFGPGGLLTCAMASLRLTLQADNFLCVAAASFP